MRNTKQRDTVLQVVRASCDHPSAETIYLRTKEILPTISLGTVYRDLSQLVAVGAIRQIVTASGGDRFDKTTRMHAHLHCRICAQVMDIGDEVVAGLDTQVANATGAIIENTDVLFMGICKQCKEESQNL